MVTPSRDPPQGSARGGWWILRSEGKIQFSREDFSWTIPAQKDRERKRTGKGKKAERNWNGMLQDSRRKRTEATRMLLRG